MQSVLLVIPLQPSVPVPVKMEGPALLLTLALVMWGGLERSVKQVNTETGIGKFWLMALP